MAATALAAVAALGKILGGKNPASQLVYIVVNVFYEFWLFHCGGKITPV